jgi:MFS transporter, putative metabolite:H+ symporter
VPNQLAIYASSGEFAPYGIGLLMRDQKMLPQTFQRARLSVSARLDRLPITSFHRRIMWLLGFVFFFELGDINSFSFAAPAIRIGWHLSIPTIGFITSATFVGMFVGATTGGWLSDHIGRKRALSFTTVWYAGFSLLNAFVWGPTGLFLARLLTGVGLSAMTVVGMTYISEMFPAKRRGAYQGWTLMIGLFGIPATAFVARFCIPMVPWGWRLVFVWGSLGILFPLFASRLEESPRWYENHGQLVEADTVLERIEETAQTEVGGLPPVPNSTQTASRRGGYAELVAPACRPRTLMLIFTWMCTTLAFYGFMSWVPTLLAEHGFSLVHSLAWSSAMSLGAVPGALIAALISDHWERKWWIPIVALVSAFCGLMYGISFRTMPIIIFGFLVAMLQQTFSPLLYAYTPECYPTEIRNSGAGLAYGVGRLANVFGPLLVAFLFNHYGYTSVFIYIATCWALVAIAVASFGPLTKGQALV